MTGVDAAAGFRRHALSCPHGQPPEGQRLDVFVDYTAFPVWARGTWPARGDRPTREGVGMASPDRLGISPQLAADLRTWADWHDAHSEYGGRIPATTEQRATQVEQGRVLADQLAEETGAEVVYAWPSGGADLDCPHCGERARRQSGG